MGGEEKETSDLIGAEAAVWTVAWVLLILAAFFWIGPIVGVIAVIVAVVLSAG